MKKKFLVLLAVFLIIFIQANPLFASTDNEQSSAKNKGAIQNLEANYEFDRILHQINSPCQPVITDDYIIFTAPAKYRSVGIAFDFENYKEIHYFDLLTKSNADGEKEAKFLFYGYKRQHKTTEIKYRLIIDGLWTTDPLNPNKEYDENINLYFSKIEDPDSIIKNTELLKNDIVRFIYKGESGLNLHLAGTFSNWDPWIYELKETSPGFYELELPLPRGKYYYNYYIGLTPIMDNTNPNKEYTADGRSANVIFVN